MLAITERAREAILEMEKNNKAIDTAVRIAMVGFG